MRRLPCSYFLTVFILSMLIGVQKPASASPAPCTVVSEKRIALVIGNSYSGAQQISGVKDAEAMAEYLCQIGFSVTRLVNADYARMSSALQGLGPRVKNADAVVFFFSGHGYQIGRKNYLLPYSSQINPTRPQIPVSEVIDEINSAPQGAVKLILLDACRTNVDLPVEGDGKLKDVPGWRPGLEEMLADDNLVFGFAADYGQVAESGSVDGFSPYTSALLRSIREPGLEIRDLFKRVKKEVLDGTNGSQSPQSKGLEAVSFYLNKPVLIPAAIPEGYSDLLVILNGEMVLDSAQKRQDKLQLKAGENDLLLLVSNGKNYRKGHTWERPEGWKYRLELSMPDGSTEIFEGKEKVPFKDGPRHGKVFTAATAKILVDPTAQNGTEFVSKDKEAWKEGPFWTKDDQEPLYEKKIKDLPLDQILDPEVWKGTFGSIPAQAVLALAREILSKGTLLGRGVANPELTYFVVRGNEAFQPLVSACTEGSMEEDRIRDLQHSIASALQRTPRPFDSFDKSLMSCMKEVARRTRAPWPEDDIKVWTCIEDRSEGAPPAGVTPVAGGFP